MQTPAGGNHFGLFMAGARLYSAPQSRMSQSTPPRGFKAFLERFTSLRTAPRELWIINGAYLMENIAYKLSAGAVLMLWLTSDLGFTRTDAGITIGWWSASLTLFTVMVGSLVDALGIRRTFLLGFWVCLAARLVMTISVSPWIAIPLGMGLHAIGLAFMSPVMVAAMKRYSTAAQRAVAFSLFYALMNAGFAIGGRLFDRLRNNEHGMGEHGTWTVPGLDIELSTYRVLILLSVIVTVPGLIVTWFLLREGVEMTEEGVRITPRAANRHAGLGLFQNIWRNCRDTTQKTAGIFKSLWGTAAFYRFLVFMGLVVFVRIIFYHLDYTLPTYAIHELGNGAPVAQVSSMLNSVLILMLVPVCGVLTSRFTAYRMVTIGSAISAVSVFCLVVPPAWFQGLADSGLGDWVVHKWLGVPGPVNPYYIAIFLFTVGLSAGEALWSPRLYEYAAAVAPRGNEASYMAISVLPYFFAKLVAGTLAGWLLDTFCAPGGYHAPETPGLLTRFLAAVLPDSFFPAEGARAPQFMWLLIACMALITPLGTFFFRKHLQVHEAGREPDDSKTGAAAGGK
jgi:MFS family permease